MPISKRSLRGASEYVTAGDSDGMVNIHAVRRKLKLLTRRHRKPIIIPVLILDYI